MPNRRHSNSSGKGNSFKKGGRASRNAFKALEAPPPTTELRKLIHSPLASGSFIVFDIETTGGNPDKNGITEIFAIRFERGAVKDTFYSMVNPKVPIPPIVRRMTGISNSMVKDAPLIEEVMPNFIEFVRDGILVSHNTIGDLKFLRHFARKTCAIELPNFFLCTHLLVDRLSPEAPNKSLKGLAKFFGLPAGNLHRAEADAHLTLELFKVLLKLLDDRAVKRIDEAIRLQGDMESALRLNWAIPQEKLRNLPNDPGVYFLYDYERKVLFLSSALSVSREVLKLQKFELVPRQLLKTVLRAYDIRVERFANFLEALIHECDSLATTSVNFKALDWHQRYIPAYCLDRSEGGYLLRVGEIKEGTIAAYGPVNDRKVAMDVCIKVARAFGGELGHNGAPNGQFLLDPSQQAVVRAFFEGRLAAYIEELQRSRRRRFIELLVRPTRRTALKQQLDAASALLGQVQLRSRALQALLNKTGVAVVPDSVAGSWQVYEVICGRPKMLQHMRGDWRAKLHQAGMAKRLSDRLDRESKKMAEVPVSASEAAKVNALLWWCQSQSGRDDSTFLELAELRKI